MNNPKQFETESDAVLRDLGAEELGGSGFEKENPDSDFTETEILVERAGRE